MGLTPAATRWAAIIDQQEASGLTVRAFATKNSLNASTLAWWRSKLGRAQRRTKKVKDTTTFDELEVGSPQPQSGTVVLALEGLDVHVVVDRDTDLQLLRRVLEALC